MSDGSPQDQAGTEVSALLALAVQHCDDGLMVIDDTGRVAICNPRAIALLQLPPELVDTRPLLSDLLARQVPENVAAALQAVQCGAGRSIPGRSWNIAFPSGETVELSAAHAAGGTVLTCKDVSLARHAQMQLTQCEAKLGTLEDKFNEVIDSVMREVTERQNRANELAAAKIAAEAATEAKSAFLASMSHEVRTPLNGILGFTELLLDDNGLSGSSWQTARKIRSAGNALLSVVNDILDFSEIEAGGFRLNCQDFSIAALIGSTLEIIEPQLLKKGLRLESQIDPSIAPQVHGDEGRLRQILLNILNNAVKFTDEGTVRMAVTRVADTNNIQAIRFEIADTGIGIPPDKRDKLFERFSQVDTSIRRKFGGTGLGLAISKQLVNLMGGEIGFRSNGNQGSVFSFVLDLKIATGSRRKNATEPVPVLQGKRVLLVEDIETNSEIAKAMIAAAGYSVDAVTDGISAIAAARTRPYDLILMDIQMPDMDGITAAQYIRRLDLPVASIPIIAMTAHVIPREVERFLNAGMNDHIGKPFSRAELLAKIAKWCAPPNFSSRAASENAELHLAMDA